MLIYGPDKPSVLPGKQTACQNIHRNNPAGRLQGAENAGVIYRRSARRSQGRKNRHA